MAWHAVAQSDIRAVWVRAYEDGKLSIAFPISFYRYLGENEDFLIMPIIGRGVNCILLRQNFTQVLSIRCLTADVIPTYIPATVLHKVPFNVYFTITCDVLEKLG